MRHDLPQVPAPDRLGGEIVCGWPVLAIAPLLFAALLRAGMGYGPLLQVCMACFLIGPALLLGMGRYPRFDDPERRSA